ncbi:MAG: hypothetical protein ACK56F_15270, partial [bacterium]
MCDIIHGSLDQTWIDVRHGLMRYIDEPISDSHQFSLPTISISLQSQLCHQFSLLTILSFATISIFVTSSTCLPSSHDHASMTNVYWFKHRSKTTRQPSIRRWGKATVKGNADDH